MTPGPQAWPLSSPSSVPWLVSSQLCSSSWPAPHSQALSDHRATLLPQGVEGGAGRSGGGPWLPGSGRVHMPCFPAWLSNTFLLLYTFLKVLRFSWVYTSGILNIKYFSGLDWEARALIPLSFYKKILKLKQPANLNTTLNYTLHLHWTRADGAMPQEGVAQTTFQVGTATALLGVRI